LANTVCITQSTSNTFEPEERKSGLATEDNKKKEKNEKAK